jgi:hypothetical protein
MRSVWKTSDPSVKIDGSSEARMSEKIGDFLVRIGAMTEEQVEEVLSVQEDSDEPRLFGEIAIEKGFIDDAALRRYVEERSGAK